MVERYAKDATAHARQRYQEHYNIGEGHCLINVRECLGIAAKEPSAIEAWRNAQHKVRTSSPADVPIGAPVYSTRPGSVYGHIMLAGGKFHNGARILWTTDAAGPGLISPVTFDYIVHVWGHHILGFTRDLNGVGIPYLLDHKGR